MKSLDQIIGKYQYPNSNFASLMHPDDTKAAAEEYAKEVLDWVFKETEYERQSDCGLYWWDTVNGDRFNTSSDLIDQYNKLPIIEQK